MAPHPDDPTTANDLTLVEAARTGDRLAFGVLYLRHHAAAWRMACVASRFSPDAELAVIEGFTRVFSALPARSETYAATGVRFRPYLLACVRQAALDRARAAHRSEHGSVAPLAGLAPDGELVLSSLDHHVARGALAALPERTRTTLWLAEVEAMTPAEIATMVGGRPDDIPALIVQAEKDLHRASQAILCGHEVRADCRFTVANLVEFQAGTLDPAKGVLVRSHLDLCPTCRMRLGELANGPATLAAAVPAAPLLGGEAQHHWLTNAADSRPAPGLLPPGLAATALAHDLPLPARRLAVAAAGVPERARSAGRTIRPVLPVVSLVVAWLAVMLSLPQLMQPDTAPGPDGLALPAVQAYVPSYLPGSTANRPTKGNAPAPHPAGNGAGTELALQLETDETPAAPPAEPPVKFVATTATPRRSTRSGGRSTPAPNLTVAAPAVTVVAAAPPLDVTPLLAAPVPVVTTTVTPVLSPSGKTKAAKELKELQRRLEELDRQLQRQAATTAASVQTRRSGVASLRAKAREDTDGRAARRTARRRHTDHTEPA